MIRQEAVAPIIDTHAHLDDEAFDSDRETVIEAAHLAGVAAILNVGYSPERWESSAQLRDRHPEFAISIGLHPHLAEQFDRSLSRSLADAVARLQPVALGETGMDFAPGNPAPDVQEQAFRGQLELAEAMRLPVIIHQRAAADALVTAIERSAVTIPIVLHSYDGTARLTDWAVERRAYVGIGGLATRRASQHLRELLAQVPPDRLLLETDAPYLVPAGVKGRRNVPANLPFVAAQLAPLWDIDATELCRVTTANAREVFALAYPLPGSTHDDGDQILGQATDSD